VPVVGAVKLISEFVLVPVVCAAGVFGGVAELVGVGVRERPAHHTMD